jgi:hypothetical protein
LLLLFWPNKRHKFNCFRSENSRYHNNIHHGFAELTGKFGENEMRVTLKPNGLLRFHTDAKSLFRSKICYSTMNANYLFLSKDRKFVPSVSPLNSSSHIIKSLFPLLDNTKIILLNDILFDLFCVHVKYESVDDTIIVSDMKVLNEIEIMFGGSGLQKTVATFVLLLYVASQPNELKYFLIDEPEAFLGSSLVMKFHKYVVQCCEDYRIRLIMTTNSKEIVENTHSDSLFHLSLELSQASFPDEDTIKQLLEFIKTNDEQQCVKDSMINSKKLLIVDGPDHISFFYHILPAQITSKYEIVSFENQCNPEVIKFLHNYFHSQVCFIRDKEFKTDENTGKYESDCNPAKVIHLNLPSIESYYLLNAMETTELTMTDILQYFMSSIQPAILFSDGFNNNNNKTKRNKKGDDSKDSKLTEHDFENMKDSIWSACFSEFNKTNNYDWIKVVNVINGHHGAEHLLKQSNTGELTKSTELTGPLVKNLIDQSVEKVRQVDAQLDAAVL